MAVLALLLVGCSTGGRTTAPRRAPTPPPTPPVVYVAVGASETTGVGADLPEQAWPEVLRRTRLPEGTVFANLGIPGATVARALNEELPRALALQPTLVTVWLNANDLVAGVPPATYEAQLRQLVRALRRGGATNVLVANTPPLELLPAYAACRARPSHRPCPVPAASAASVPPPHVVTAAVQAYNAAIARVTGSEGAVLVDLHGASLRTVATGGWAPLVSGDGFHPSTLGHRAVADAFAQAL